MCINHINITIPVLIVTSLIRFLFLIGLERDFMKLKLMAQATTTNVIKADGIISLSVRYGL